MNWKALFVVAVVIALTGCGTQRLPQIEHHHWNRTVFGAELYSDKGEESASFISSFADAAQVCDFEFHEGCHYFETNDKSLRWLNDIYIIHQEKTRQP